MICLAIVLLSLSRKLVWIAIPTYFRHVLQRYNFLFLKDTFYLLITVCLMFEIKTILVYYFQHKLQWIFIMWCTSKCIWHIEQLQTDSENGCYFILKRTPHMTKRSRGQLWTRWTDDIKKSAPAILDERSTKPTQI